MILLYFFCIIQVGDFQFSSNTLVSVTVSVMNHHHSKCVYVLNSGNHQGSASFRYLKTLATTGNFSATSIPMDTNLKTLEASSCQGNSPLYVLLSNDATTQKYLEQVAMKYLLSRGRWLMFFSSKSIEIFFSRIKIPYDCEFLVTQPSINEDEREVGLSLIEIYQDHPSRSLQKHLVAYWTTYGGLNWSAPFLIHRRANLHGVPIRVGLLDADYAAAVERNCSRDTPSDFCEVEYEIWLVLQEKLNFTSVFYRPEDEKRIYNISNNSCPGYIAMLLLDQVDIIVKKFAMISSRASYLTFTSTPFPEKVGTYVKKEVSNNSNWRLISLPFSYEFWWVISAALIVLIFLLSVTWHVSSISGMHQGGENFNFYNSLLCVFGIFCQQGHDTSPQSWPCRLIFITTYITCVILFIAYSAIFIAILTVNRYKLPFTDFKGLLDTETYRLLLPARDAYSDIFKEAKDPVLRTIYTRMVEPNVHTFPKNERETLQKVCSGSRHAAVVDSYDAKYNEVRLACKLIPVPRAYFWIPASFLVNKNSSYTKIFSYNIEMMRNSGILKKLNENTLPIKTKESDEPKTQGTLEDILPVLIILLVGVLAATTCLIVEISFYRLRNYFRKEHNKCSIKLVK